MKLKLIFALLLIAIYSRVNAQYGCSAGSPWGSACVGINTNDVILSTCNWAGEYATATGLVPGQSYNVNTCGGSWDSYIEVRDASNTSSLIAAMKFVSHSFSTAEISTGLLRLKLC